MNDAVYVNNAMANEVRRNRTLADFALLYADEGFRVLPLHSLRSPGCCSCGFESCSSVAKHPRTFKGVKDATYQPEQVREWWRLYPDANIGIATGQGMLVIDIDPKNGGSLEALNAVLPLPPTATVHTGGGGFHLYFMCSLSYKIRNSVSKLAPGIDVRGENGYVVAPPSIHATGNRYYWESHKGFAVAPRSLIALVAENASPPLRHTTSPSPAPIIISSDPAPTVASPPLPQNGASTFIPEGKRNATLVSLAGSLRNQGANEEALFISLQAINKGCCQPPLTDDEVRQICKSAVNWTPGVSGKVPSSGALLVKQVTSLRSEDRSSPPWAIPGLLPEGVSLLAGKPKMGKSWLALSMAISIAHGDCALGSLPTNQGTVLYMGLEDNEHRICSRVDKLAQGIPPALFWSGSSAPLTMGGLTDLEAWIASSENPRLIVIDTFARVRAQHGSTNGSVYADDYAAITPLKYLAEQYHLSILLIHHLRKSGATDPMDEISGLTGLTGATDCNMVLQRERGQNKAALHITGRDVEDQVLKLSFDNQNGRWSLNSSPSDEKTLSPIRESILSLLAQKGHPLSPAEIATALGLENDIVRKKLSLMKQAGKIGSAGRGLYQLTSNTLDIDTPDSHSPHRYP